MYSNLINGRKKSGILMAAALTLGVAVAWAQEAVPDNILSRWLGTEFTVQSSTINDHMPVGGKLTFIFDSADNIVRVCTRTVSNQRSSWNMDFTVPCGVTLTFTRGTRFCTIDDVKAGNAEVLSSCHRLRSSDVAMHPPRTRGTIELNDMIAFLVEGPGGKTMMSILVDSPSRVTDSGVIILSTSK